MDTSSKIIEASIIVFTDKGYLGSSTKEIAKTAEVAEMTLFRKFGSKQNLFEEMIKSTLGQELSDVLDINF
ncbi:MAG: helix-turn-helix transcriptional regulator, partial [Tenericutes bacterium]|nr:helix-turn-helix transcriptional regulator [Mycoplasmatota bacterium]